MGEESKLVGADGGDDAAVFEDGAGGDEEYGGLALLGGQGREGVGKSVEGDGSRWD